MKAIAPLFLILTFSLHDAFCSPTVSGLLKDLDTCVADGVIPAFSGNAPKSAVTIVQTGSNCTAYGDPPAKVVNDIVSPTGLEDLVTLCGGEIVTIKDNSGLERKACLYVNPASTMEKPLPLVVWLHPSLVSATFSWPLTGWDLVKTTQVLNNEDPSAKGFSYILPFGRNTEHKCE